jgi:hypothetical protein
MGVCDLRPPPRRGDTRVGDIRCVYGVGGHRGGGVVSDRVLRANGRHPLRRISRIHAPPHSLDGPRCLAHPVDAVPAR